MIDIPLTRVDVYIRSTSLFIFQEMQGLFTFDCFLMQKMTMIIKQFGLPRDLREKHGAPSQLLLGNVQQDLR